MNVLEKKRGPFTKITSVHANAKVVLTIPEYTYTCIYNVQTSLYNHIFYLKVCKKVDLYNSPCTSRVHGLLMHCLDSGIPWTTSNSASWSKGLVKMKIQHIFYGDFNPNHRNAQGHFCHHYFFF